MKKFFPPKLWGGENCERMSVNGLFRAARTLALALSLTLAFAAFPAQAQTPAQEKTITLQVTDTPVSTVMKQIESQSGYTFFYNTKDIPLSRNVTLSVSNENIRTTLDKLFQGTNVTYSIDDKSIILSTRQKAQTPKSHELVGRILDKKGQPVIGATVMISGSMQGTTSGIDGTFSFPYTDALAQSTLDISFIGYRSLSIPVNNRTMLDITLEEDDQQIEAVVVTALGIKRSERAVSYNVQNLTDDVFKTRDANMVNSLSGRIAGVTVNASAAGVGGETKVVMRGSKSISGNNNALYVLDGIPLPSLSLTNPGDSFTIMREDNLTGDGISNFNADDIASMSALTGPSAAALYGSQAANGVLMLTTRTGEKGLSVNYSNNTTFMSPFVTPAFQNTYGAKDGYYASWGSKLSKPSSWNPVDFFQTGYNTSNSLSVSFGGERSQTYISAGVVTAEGIIPNNEYNRYNFTANHSSSFLKDRMHLSVLGMYMNVNEQNMLSSGQYYNPMIPVYLMSPSDDINKYAVYERYDASRNFPVQYWPWGSQSLQMQNPYWITNRNMFNTGKDRFLFGASLKYDITDWLDVTGRARIDYTNMLSEQRNYASTLGLFAGDKGRYYNNHYTTMQRYADVLANIHKTFADDKISLNVTLGASIEDYKHRATLLGGDLTGVPNLFTLANMTTNKSLAKETINDQTQSIFATAQIGYKNMLFLDVTAREDWTTALANTANMSMFYPSVGVSAVLTDLFGIKSKVLSYAKIRASYAEVGNAPMRWITIPTYPVSDGVPQTSTYLTSDDFQPERTKSWEIGADVRLWGNKLILGATYYNSRTYNQVFNPDISSTSTYSSLYVNAGRVDNKGIELSAELNQNLGPVEWTSNVVYSRNRNKVVKMLDSYRLSNGTVISQDSMVMGGTSGVKMVLREGGQIGDIYVNTLKTDEHGMIWVSPTGSTVAPDKDNWIYAGNSNPSYTLSWRNEFRWKGLSLAFMFNARVGGVGVSLTQATMDYFGVSERTAIDRDNGGALVNGQRIPAESFYQTIGGNGADAIGSMYVYSMTNVRLGELTLGYDIPVQKWCKWIKKLNVSFVGRNLWMLYCKAPFDPESVAGTGTYSSGIDYFMQPSTRNLGFSVKVTF